MNRAGLALFLAALLPVLAAAGPAEPVHRPSLVKRAQLMDEYLAENGLLRTDSALVRYLDGILQKLLAAHDRSGPDIRIRVMRGREVSAFAAPNNAIYVTTGILARMTNEAQCAALLGHEATHILNDHMFKQMEKSKASARTGAQARLVLEWFLGAGLASVISDAGIRTAITGFSRDREREADSLGLVLMYKAGYPGLEFRNFFMLLQKYLEEEDIKEPYFFSTHPAVADRIDNYYEIAGRDTAAAAAGDAGEAPFRAATQPLILENARQNLAAGRLAVARAQTERYLRLEPLSVEAWTIQGDICRFQANPAASAEALACYEKAAAQGPPGNVGERGLGLYFFKTGDPARARPHLQAYADAHPEAPDRPLILRYLEQCANP